MLELVGPSSGEVSFCGGVEKMLVLCSTQARPVDGGELKTTRAGHVKPDKWLCPYFVRALKSVRTFLPPLTLQVHLPSGKETVFGLIDCPVSLEVQGTC